MSSEVHSKGRVIGYRSGKPIVEWITYEQADHLVRFHFVRLAMEDQDGGMPLSQLKDGEVMIAPGAIYR